MPDLKISQLNNGDPAQSNDQVPVNRAGVNFSITAGSIAALSPPTTPAGSNTQVQFNDGGAFGGDPQFTFNPTGDVLSLTGQLNVDNIRVDGNTVSSTDTNGNIDLTPNGTGEVNISKVDIDSGAIDGTTIGGSSAAAGTFTTATATTGNITAVNATRVNAALFGAQDTTLSFSRNTSTSSNSSMVLSNGALTIRGEGSFNFSSEGNAAEGGPDVRLFRDAADTLAQRRSTNAQTFRIYNTFTDASNYERGKMEWASNVLRIGTEKAGTGTARALELQTDGTTRLTIATGGTATFSSDILSGNFIRSSQSHGFLVNGRAGFVSPTTENIKFRNANDDGFGLLQFGGTTSSFPALKRDSTTVAVRLADDSGNAPLSASTLSALAATANTSSIASTGYSVTGSNNTALADLAGTWNTTGTPTAVKVNITDTASDGSSLLMDLQTTGVSQFSVNKAGGLTAKTGVFSANAGNLSSIAASNYALSGTSAVSMVDLAGTWNTTGTPTLIKANVTDTASNAASLLMDLQVGGVSRFSVSKSAGVLFQSNVIEQRNSTNAQTFRLYNTFTDASNYERGKMEWASNVLRIGTEKAGTGTARELDLQANGTTVLRVSSAGSPAIINSGAVSFANAIWTGVADGFTITTGGGTFTFTRENATTGALQLNRGFVPSFLSLGGVTNTGTRIVNSSTTVRIRLGDDTANAPLESASVKTDAPTGGTSGTWKLGVAATVTPTLANRTIEVDIGGTIYYIAAKTTND